MADTLLVGEGALRLLKVLGEQEGVVVALEDLHWADPDSLAVIEYLCEHGPSEGLVIAATVRDDPGPGIRVAKLTGTLCAEDVQPSEMVAPVPAKSS